MESILSSQKTDDVSRFRLRASIPARAYARAPDQNSVHAQTFLAVRKYAQSFEITRSPFQILFRSSHQKSTQKTHRPPSRPIRIYD